MRDEARNMIVVLRAAATQPAGEEGVRQVVGRRFALYPQPDRSDQEWAAWWSDYLDTLEGVSWAALEAAMAAYVADPASEFMPKPGKLLELAKTTPNIAVKRFNRARKVEHICGPYRAAIAHEPERPEPSPAEKAEVMDMLAKFKATAAERTPEKVTVLLPSIAGKPDAGGLTPAMRALMARRAGEQQ